MGRGTGSNTDTETDTDMEMDKGMRTGAGAATLDHVGLVGPDLRAMRAAMQRLGFAPTQPQMLMGSDPMDPARSISLEQQSCHLVLGQGYVELSAVLAVDERHHLAPWRAHGPGLTILALGAADLEAARERCVAAGLEAGPVQGAARSIEYGSTHGTARFRWWMLQPAASPEGLLCFVQNLTPELVFQPEVMQHPNGALALEEIVVRVADPSGAARRYAAVLDCTARVLAPTRAAGAGLEFALPGGVVSLATGQHLQQRFGAAADALGGPAARFAALRIRVRDLDALADAFARDGVPFERRGAELVVPPAAACGAVLAFCG
jgi:hypothetical protein